MEKWGRVFVASLNNLALKHFLFVLQITFMYAMYDPLILGILGGVATLYSIGLCKSSNTKILNTLVTTDLAQPLHSHSDIRE